METSPCFSPRVAGEDGMLTWFGAKTGASNESSHGQGGCSEEQQPQEEGHESQDEL